MYKLQADAGEVNYKISLEGVQGRDRHGNTFPISEADVIIDVFSSDEGIVAVNKKSETEGTVRPGGVMGVGTVTVTVSDNKGGLLATESATFVVGHGSLAGISAIGLSFEGLSEEKPPEPAATAEGSTSSAEGESSGGSDPLADVSPTIAPEGSPTSHEPPPLGVGPTASSPTGIAPESSTVATAGPTTATNESILGNTSTSTGSEGSGGEEAAKSESTSQSSTDTETSSPTSEEVSTEDKNRAEISEGTDESKPTIGEAEAETPTPGGEQSSSAGMPLAPDENTSPLTGGVSGGEPATSKDDLAGERTDAEIS